MLSRRKLLQSVLGLAVLGPLSWMRPKVLKSRQAVPSTLVAVTGLLLAGGGTFEVFHDMLEVHGTPRFLKE